MRIMESLRSELLLREEKGWKTTASPRLSSNKQMDHEKSQRLATNPPGHRPTTGMYTIHQSQHPLGVQQYTNQRRRRVESHLPHP